MADCEAAERNKQALHELELQWGAGRLDYGRIRAILTGRDVDECAGRDTPQIWGNLPKAG